jgi:hypothetical protein
VADALTAAYCPVIAAGDAPSYQKKAELRRFTLQVESSAAVQAAGAPYPDVVWATPVGHTLVSSTVSRGRLPESSPAPPMTASWCRRTS